jgi:fucose permease
VTRDAATRNLSLTVPVIAATYLGMLSIGAVNSSYGAALDVLRVTLGASAAQLGLLGTAQTVGGVLGNLLTTPLQPRLTAGQRMIVGGALFAIGAVWFGLETRFFLACAALFVLGTGMGLIQVTYSSLFSRGFGMRSSAVMSAMSTAFAVGSIAGPALAAGLGGAYRWLPLGFGALWLVLVVLLRPARDLELPRLAHRHGALGTREWLFALMVVLYVASEQGASFWIVTHLEGLGLPKERAALVVSAFWLLLLVGRLVAAALSLVVSNRTLLTGSALLGVAAFALAHVDAVAWLAYPLAGLALAPVFPTGLVWMASRTPSPHGTTLYLVAGSAGAAVGLPLIGWLTAQYGAGTIPTALTALMLGCALVIALLAAHERRDEGQRAAVHSAS